MERVSKSLVERFDAVDESGNEYELLIYQEFTNVELQLSTMTVPGDKYVVTSTGQKVNVIDNDTFVIVAKNIKLRRVKS